MQLFIAGEITKVRSEDLDESERILQNVMGKELKRLGVDCKSIQKIESNINRGQDIELSELCKRYPFVNEATEFRYPVNSRILKGLQVRRTSDFILNSLCFEFNFK